MKDTIFRVLQPSVRHGLQLLGGALASYGVIEDAQIPMFVGLGVSLITWAWMLLNDRLSHKDK